LHKRFLESSYQFTSPFPFHLIPSIKGFRYAILSGYGYGLIPMMDVKEDLERGDLVLLSQRHKETLSLYLHHWGLMSDLIKEFIDALKRYSSDLI